MEPSFGHALFTRLAGVESTYDSTTNPPTNQPPTAPTSYVTLRLTYPHSEWSKIDAVIDAPWYICYPHTGGLGKNEHFHVLLPGTSAKDVERFRKRIKTIVGTGNERISAKLGQNGIASAITYCTHEKTQPITRGDCVHPWILNAPAWVSRELVRPTKKPLDENDFSKPNKEKHYLLGYNNLVRQALRYRARFLAKQSDSSDLSVVLTHMYVHSDWRLSATILKQGIPRTYYTEFAASVEHTMADKFTKGYFNMMIRDDAHDNRDKW